MKSAKPPDRALRADQVKQPPMRGRYFVRHKGFNRLFRMLDAVLGMFVYLRPLQESRPARRILIANGAHLGDVVLSTAVLPAIREAFPEARIGMLVGSWSRPVVRDHPMLDWVHTVDHWKISRARISLWEKMKVYWRTRRQALGEMREIGYDVAVDLYFYFPNAFLLLRQAGIPQRIGYTSGGFGPLLTRSLDLTLGTRSVVEYHCDLLRLIPGGERLNRAHARPVLPRVSFDVARVVGAGAYVVLHMGSGSPLKDWPLEKWRELALALVARGRRLVFTGSGERERLQIEALLAEVDGNVNLCDRLKWPEFVEVVGGASLLVGVDSVAGHVAAAVGTPVIVVGHGMNNPVLWRPLADRSIVLTHPMPCAPCYRKTGCATLDCIRGLAPELVMAEVDRLFAAPVRRNAEH